MIEQTGITHSDLVRDLRLLREKGLLRLRGLEVPALDAAAQAGKSDPTSESDPTAVEAMLREAVDALGDEEPGQAARYLFGLVQGTVGRRPAELRERAARIYGLSAETFRKEPERLLVARVAEEILILRRHSDHGDDRRGATNTPSTLNQAIDQAPQEAGAPTSAGRDQYIAGGDLVVIHGNQTTSIQISRDRVEPPEPVRGALPPDVLDFTGREHELRQIIRSAGPDALRDTTLGGAVQIHAIDGMPGVGKTALAIHAGHLLCADTPGHPARFPDGQVFLDLRGHTPGQEATSPAEALASLLTADGVDPRYLPETVDERSAMWRDRLSRRQLLLVLDNAASSAQVAPLLPGLPGCLTLITSRRRLGDLPGRVNVLALDAPPQQQARAMFLKLTTGERNEDRAITESAVDEVVTLAGRLPLAISLLARVFAQHPTWTMDDLLDETRTRLLTLTAEQATVTAAFDLSYELLPPERQRFFRRIGLHPGIELDTTAAACLGGISGAEAVTFLDALHLDHLVIEVGYRRYGMHDLIRSYLMGRVAEDPPHEREQALTRLLDYYQQVTETANTYLVRQTRPRRPIGAQSVAIDAGGTSEPASAVGTVSALASSGVQAVPVDIPGLQDRVQALTWVRRERSNLLACIALAAMIDPPRLVALTAGLTGLLRLDGPWDEAAALITTAAQTARKTGDWFGEAEALTSLGQFAYLSGSLSGADALARARHLFDQAGESLGVANAISNQAGLQFLRANYPEAEAGWRDALARYQVIEDRLGEANTLTDLGNVLYRIGDTAGAAEAMERSMALHHALGNPEGEALALTNLGVVHYRTGAPAEATPALQRALGLYQYIGDRRGEANALTYLGAVMRMTRDYHGVTEALTPALDLHRGLGHRLGEANTLLYLGSAMHLSGDRGRAAEMLQETLELYRDLEHPLGEANTRLYLGVLHRDDGNFERSQAELQRSLAVYREIGDSGGEVEALNEFGTLYRRLGDLPRAGAHHQESLVLSRHIDSAWDEAHALAGLAHCARDAGQLREAVTGLQEAIEIFQRMGVPEAAETSAELEILIASQHERDGGPPHAEPLGGDVYLQDGEH